MQKFTSIFSTAILLFILLNNGNAQTRRYVKAIATGSGNGSSWANASSDLQAMINASASNDEIWVAKGTYTPVSNTGFFNASHVLSTDPRHRCFYINKPVKILGGFAGSEAAASSRKWWINKTILSGDFLGNDAGFTNNGENAYKVIMVNSYLPDKIIIDGFTITGGNTTGMPATYLEIGTDAFSQITPDGAAATIIGGFFEFNNDIFIYNSANNGGAINSSSVNGEVVNCLFLHNNATGNGGAVVSTDNAGFYVNNTFFGNTSSGPAVYGGGGIYGLILIGSIVWGNTGSAGTGGAIIPVSNIIQGIDSDPLFINPSDPDGADNILGNADDGLIPQCGPAIGGGTNFYQDYTTPVQSLQPLPSKDLKGGTRILNGTADAGAYETSLIHSVTGFTIYSLSNHATTENLPAGLCQGMQAVFSTPITGNGGAFQWTQNGNNVGTNSNRLSITNFQSGDQIRLTLTNPAGCGPAGPVQSNTVILGNVSSAKPVITSNITGPVNACPYITGPVNGPTVTYKINKVPGALVYHWYFSGVNTLGASIVSHPAGTGVNDTIVTVAFNSNWNSATGTRTLYVSAENWCGVSSAKKLSVSQKLPGSAGSFISYQSDACPFMQSASNPSGTPVTYAIQKVLDASSYIWTVPSGASIQSHAGTGENDTAINVIFSSSFVSGSVSVQAVNFCGAKAPRVVSVSKKIAGKPGSITGPTESCPYVQSAGNPSGIPVDYTIRKVTYAASYNWTLPAGTSATHPGGTGVNDTIIRVTYAAAFTGGTISVTANTNCNTSDVRTLTITRNIPAMPYYIIGLTDVCSVMQSPNNPSGTATDYTIKKVAAATSYTWSVPANTSVTHPGGTGVNDTIIRVTYLSGFTGGTISVVSNGNCGSSVARTLDILRRLPSAPGSITAGAPTACPQRRITYSLSSMPAYATSVQWTVPASGNIISGQGTTSIIVEFAGTTSSTDTIRAVGVNDCANSTQRKLRVGVLPSCRPAGDVPYVGIGSKISVKDNNELLGITVMPNPSNQHFALVLSHPDCRLPVNIQVLDATGRQVESRQNIQNKSTIYMGHSWKPGVYFATFVQGQAKKVIRLIKL